MKDIVNFINEGQFSEWWSAKCVKEHKTKYHTFTPGEEVEASKINDNWWIIDAIGISKDDFDKCFKKNKKLDK